MTPAEMEKRLLEIQFAFKDERSAERRAALRTEYRALHEQWMAIK